MDAIPEIWNALSGLFTSNTPIFEKPLGCNDVISIPNPEPDQLSGIKYKGECQPDIHKGIIDNWNDEEEDNCWANDLEPCGDEEDECWANELEPWTSTDMQ